MTDTSDTLRLLATAFTRPFFTALARTGDHQGPFKTLLARQIVCSNRRLQRPLAAVFEDAWGRLVEQYRNEYVYKNDLASRLVFGRHSPRTAGFQVELPVGRSIVDVAVANGTTTAYEIKTEYDTAKRLESQTTDYLKAFDRVFVVTHPGHLDRFARELDPRVGILTLSTKGALSVQRDAVSNASNVDPAVIFRCLRRDEYLSAVAKQFGPQPDLPNGLVGTHCGKLFSTLAPVEAHRVLIEALKARTTDKNTVKFVTQLPPSLRALGYATPLSNRQRETLLALLEKPVGLTVSP